MEGSTAKGAALTRDARRERLEQLIEAEEGAFNRLSGWIGLGITAFAVAVSLFHLYAALEIVPPHVLRPAHVGMVLALCFLLFPMARRFRDRIRWWDYLLAAGAAATMLYVLWQGADFGDRATAPTQTDWLVGLVFVVLLLEGTRRATGWIMPGVAIAFILYALFGNRLPYPWTHRGYAPEDLVAHLYMTLEGIFGTTVDVASSLIILFTIFGAVLAQSGAGRFFIDFSFAAMGGRRNAAGRAVVLSSFLLGGPSGSGVATTVTIGTVAYPLLAKAGYDKNAAGGLFAAGGLGAIISPPVLGAAAFLIAEFLEDLLLRRDPHGDAADAALLFRHPGHGGDRRAQAGRRGRAAGGKGRGVAPHQGLLVPLRLADFHHRLHAARLLAGARRILGDRAGDRGERPALGHRHRPLVGGVSRWSWRWRWWFPTCSEGRSAPR